MYKQPERWEDCQRDDLKGIPLMEANGFTVHFSDKDRMHKRTTIESIPSDSVSFRKGDMRVWKTYKKIDDALCSAWTVAKLVANHYTGHQVFDELEDVIKHMEVTHPAQTQTN